ncbi:single stranded nucleic acid binding protein [Haplosporangium gracile]|nr:single stranded nucleic acid binding protein [Haplosporangium gracile]
MSDNHDTVAVEEETEVHFEPIVKLEAVQVKTHEEEEDSVFKMRAKLFRFVKESNEWKERGTGDVRLMQHKETKKIRLLMRRDQTHKICANHYVTADMTLTPNVGSDRSWVWNVTADSSDECTGPQTLAIRLANSDNAALFKEEFEKAQKNNIELKSAAEDKEEKKEDTKEEKKDEEEKKEDAKEEKKEDAKEEKKDEEKKEESA